MSGPRREAAGTDAGKPGTADAGEDEDQGEGETKGEVTGSTPAKVKGEIMGTVYKKTVTKPLPAGAKIIVRKGQRFAEWKDAKGKTPNGTAHRRRGSDHRGSRHLHRQVSGRLGNRPQEVATGCRDESAARSVLTDLERRAEQVRAKILTAAEDATRSTTRKRRWRNTSTAYLDDSSEAEGTRRAHRTNVRRACDRVAADCRFQAARPTCAAKPWNAGCAAREGRRHGAANPQRLPGRRRGLLQLVRWKPAGCWAIPFAKVPKADRSADPRRQRRALTEDELSPLLGRGTPPAAGGRDDGLQGPAKGRSDTPSSGRKCNAGWNGSGRNGS